MNILEKYLNVFNCYSWNNEMFGKLTFHSILGQLLRHNAYDKGGLELDPRIHLFFIQDSGCLYKDTFIQTDRGDERLSKLPDTFNVKSYNFVTNEVEFKSALKIDSGKKELYKITLEDYRVVYASKDHVFFKKHRTGISGSEIMVKDMNVGDKLFTFAFSEPIKRTGKIQSIEKVREMDTFDLKVEDNNNFFLSNGILSHNSGKSTAYECIGLVLKGLGLRYIKMDEPNTAALIGTQEESKIKDKDGSIKPEYNQTTGILSWANMILVDEGVVLLSPKTQGNGILVVLQTLMNPIGSESNRYEKPMAHGDPIEIHPEGSLIVTSIMPPGLDALTLTGGFLQRVLLFPRWLTDKDRLMNAMTDIELLGIKKKTAKKIDNIVEEFEKIDEFYDDHEIEFPKKIKPYIKQLVKKMFVAIEKTDVNIKPILFTFLSRYQNFMYTLAYHYCAMDLRTKVTTRDFDKAYAMISEIFGEIAFWLESTLKISKMETKMHSYKLRIVAIFASSKYMKQGYVSVSALVKEIAKVLRVSKPTARNYINEFKKRKILEEKDRKIYLKEE